MSGELLHVREPTTITIPYETVRLILNDWFSQAREYNSPMYVAHWSSSGAPDLSVTLVIRKKKEPKPQKANGAKP